MNAWEASPLYRVWVIGGPIAVVAFTVIGGTSDPSNRDFIFTLIPVVAVWMAGIFVLQWRVARRDARSDSPALREGARWARWSIGYGALLCIAIFAGVWMFYADVGGTLYPLGESGPGLPVALLPAFALVLYGAARTLWMLRDAGPDEPAGPREFTGPTDIPDRQPPAGRGS